VEYFNYKIGIWLCFQKFPALNLPTKKNNSSISVYTVQYNWTSPVAQLPNKVGIIDDLGCHCIVGRLQLYKVTSVILDSHQGEWKWIKTCWFQCFPLFYCCYKPSCGTEQCSVTTGSSNLTLKMKWIFFILSSIARSYKHVSI
jgi:hypothetical protein